MAMIVGCQFASWEFVEKNVRRMQEFFSPNTIEGFREVKESHQAALWFGGLKAITDGLRDSKNLGLAVPKLAEASLFAAKPSSCLG